MNTRIITFHRVFACQPEPLYRAFTEIEALVKWLPPHGFYAKVYKWEPRVGGEYKMAFLYIGSGKGDSFGGKFLVLVPNQKIVHTDSFDNPDLPGEMRTTIELGPVAVGTEIHIKQEGIPINIPLEACTLGWQQSLNLLQNFVEANIPGL